MTDASAADLTEQADALIGAERYDEAADVARRLVSLHPGCAAGHVRLARIFYRTGNPAAAEEHAERATEIAPDDLDAFLLLADARLDIKGRGAEAETAARRAVELNPADWRCHATLAGALRSQLHWTEAEEPQRTFLELAPNKTVPRIQLAMLLTRIAKPEEAEVHFDIVLSAGTSASNVTTAMGMIESCGIPTPLKDIYARYSRAVGRPDLSEPGAAGRDPELLAEQAKIAKRLASPLGQDPATSRASLERAKALATAVLAVDPDNETARTALSNVENSEGMPNVVHTDPKRARKIAREFKAMGKRLNETHEKVDVDNVDSVVTALQAVHDGFTLYSEYGMTSGLEEYTRVVETDLGRLRELYSERPDGRRELAEKLSAAELASAFAEFHYWLLTGPDTDVGGKLGSHEIAAAEDDDVEGSKL